MKIANAKNTTKNTITIFYQSNIFDYYIMKNGTITEILHLFSCPLWGAATLKHPNLRIFKGFFNINLRIFVYSMEINLRIFNIIRIFALRKYQIVSNFYIKNKEKNI